MEQKRKIPKPPGMPEDLLDSVEQLAPTPPGEPGLDHRNERSTDSTRGVGGDSRSIEPPYWAAHRPAPIEGRSESVKKEEPARVSTAVTGAGKHKLAQPSDKTAPPARDWSPKPKVVAAAVTVPFSGLVLWIAGELGVNMPPQVAGEVAVLIALIVAYLVPER